MFTDFPGVSAKSCPVGRTPPRKRLSLFEPRIIRAALSESLRKLDPRTLICNPVMFVVEVVALATTALLVREIMRPTGQGWWFVLQIALWLWFTVLFANFAEAMAEGRGKAQADSLRQTQCDTIAKLIKLYLTIGPILLKCLLGKVLRIQRPRPDGSIDRPK